MPYLTGRAFGLADVAYLPWVIRARDLLGLDLDRWPALEDWLRRASERPVGRGGARAGRGAPR